MILLKIAAAYIRVSTDGQVELSPASQLKEIREFAKRNDYIIPDEYIYQDDGISARTIKKRTAFIKMIAAAKIKPKPFDAIIVWKFSRFARSREDSIVFKSQLRKIGVSVLSVAEPIVDDGKMSIIIEGMIESMDEYYSANLSEEVKRGMLEKFQRKQAMSAAPYGYRFENKKFIPVPEEADIIREIFERFVSGESAFKISQDLNKRGIKTKKDNIVERRTVQYYLENPVYRGAIRYSINGNGSRGRYSDGNYLIQEDCHEPIISSELFLQAQNIIIQNKLKYGGKQNHTVYEYALKGIVKCSECGHNLTFSSRKDKSPRMHCPMYFHNKCGSSSSVTIKSLTDSLIADLQAALDNKDLEIDFNHTNRLTVNKDAQISQQLSRAELKLKRVKDAYAAGIDTLEEYAENKKKLLAEINALKKQIQPTAPLTKTEKERRMREFRNKIRSAVKIMQNSTSTEQEKNALLHSFISSATYNSKTKTLSVFYYG